MDSARQRAQLVRIKQMKTQFEPHALTQIKKQWVRPPSRGTSGEERTMIRLGIASGATHKGDNHL
jgi:hypothetical protein